MKTIWHDIWASAKGPITSHAPQTRLLAGLLLMGACILSPADQPLGIGLSLLGLLFWFWICRPRARVVKNLMVFGTAMFAPYFLLAFLSLSDSGAFVHTLMASWRVFFRGLLVLLISVITMASLHLSELRFGILKLPVPSIIGLILLQIVHQTMTLTYETKCIMEAIAVRGATGKVRTLVGVLITLPVVWLPRMVERAENVAAAMEVRGYVEVELRDMGGREMGRGDLFLLLGLMSWLGLVCWIRIKG